MGQSRSRQRLAAILATDAAGYSRLMAADEAPPVAALDAGCAGLPEERRLRFRVGVHVGDAIEKADGTIHGDGVNIAARLLGLCPDLDLRELRRWPFDDPAEWKRFRAGLEASGAPA